jgi:hypothetical protein
MDLFLNIWSQKKKYIIESVVKILKTQEVMDQIKFIHWESLINS